MNDTVKIERPLCCRRQEDLGGRIKQDPLGNTIRARTRVHDSPDDLVGSWREPEVNQEPASEVGAERQPGNTGIASDTVS
jgi:hypothetical protein